MEGIQGDGPYGSEALKRNEIPDEVISSLEYYTTEITKVNEITQVLGRYHGSSQFLNWKCRRLMWTKKMDGRTRGE